MTVDTNSHKMSHAEFRCLVERIEREAREFQAQFWEVIAEFGCFRCSMTVTDCRGRSYVKAATFTPSVYPVCDWQLTYFENDEATGHLLFNNEDDAAREVRSLLRQGYKPDNEFKDILSSEAPNVET